jgi:hypothetical protein
MRSLQWLRPLLLVSLVCACAPKPKATVPPELHEIVAYLQAHPTPGAVLTLTDTGAAAVAQAGRSAFVEPAGEAALLARDVTALQQLMDQQHVDYLLTTEPDFHDAPNLTRDKMRLLPSLLTHLVTLYGTGTHDYACVDGLALVATSSAIRNVGGRHLPAGLLWQRVPGARLVLHKLVPGIPVRVETRRTFASQTFVFDCQARADDKGDLEMRFPYAALPDAPVQMWTAMGKVGEPIPVTADAVVKGQIVDLTQ